MQFLFHQRIRHHIAFLFCFFKSILSFFFFENLQKKKRPQLLVRRSLYPLPIVCGNLQVRSLIYSGVCSVRCTQRLLRIWRRSLSSLRLGFVRTCTIYAERQWMKTIVILIMILIDFIFKKKKKAFCNIHWKKKKRERERIKKKRKKYLVGNLMSTVGSVYVFFLIFFRELS